MDTLNVVVTANIPEGNLNEIETADPRLRVKSAGPLFRIERQKITRADGRRVTGCRHRQT